MGKSTIHSTATHHLNFIVQRLTVMPPTGNTQHHLETYLQDLSGIKMTHNINVFAIKLRSNCRTLILHFFYYPFLVYMLTY